ncbi:uncharacterized protein EI90DRAFT_3023140 [Cantharellus anzutake]|uniref:uncharacterized protein n=1 Tax=Cantharellus anzutake TaxID=1750568 RepID=UPI001904CF7D|nr:uncharacterized protein EI90DRAFT_3023140 [Cantharellus anzutake]KAF8312170.1 hypothetical protein EI90DRAFT_3023140 [Cantharellus anzutake]
MPILPPITLSSLEHGLTALKSDAQPLIDKLKAKLASRISITNEEETWLDGAANFTDETLLIAELQHAKNFQIAFESLSDNRKATAQRMQAASSAKNHNSEAVADAVPETGRKFNSKESYSRYK